MVNVAHMLVTHPSRPSTAFQELVDCIQACIECGQTCTACADACLGQKEVEHLVSCIRANLDCADISATLARYLTRQTHIDWYLAISLLDSCTHACEVCADECAAHAEMHEHCRICEDACRRCADACRRLMGALPDPTDVA